MKKLLFLSIALCCACATTQAQTAPEQRDERLAAFRAEVYTRTLRLSPEEAQGFWPVYNEFMDRRDQILQETKPAKQEDQMSDAEVEDQIKRHFERKQRELDLERDLYQKLRKTLPLRKIAKIPKAEREFRETLVKRLQEKRQNRIENKPGMRRGR